MIELIKSKLEGIPPDSVILTIIPTEHYQEINMFMVKHWLEINPGHRGTYISLNRPFNNLVSTLQRKDVDTSRLFFVDCVTKREEADIGNCIFIGTENSLTRLGIALSSLVSKEELSFVYLDSLNTLALYNGLDSAIKFTHFLITKLRNHSKNGIILGINEHTNKKIINELSQLCDVVIDLADKTTFT